MSRPDELISAMRAEGIPDPTILAVIARLASDKREAARASNAERQRRFRENNARNGVTPVTHVTRDPVTEPSAYIARADAPVCSNDFSNEKSKLDTPLPSEGPRPEKRKSGTCLPEDWSPPEELFAYGAEHGLSRKQTAEIIEGMRLWARANRNQAKARKADWISAMQGAIRRDAPKFNARAGPAANRGGVGKLLYESLETHGDLTNDKRENGHVDGSKKTGIAQNVCRLPFDGMPGRNDDPEHDRVVSGNSVDVLIGNSYRRM